LVVVHERELNNMHYDAEFNFYGDEEKNPVIVGMMILTAITALTDEFNKRFTIFKSRKDINEKQKV
jgi:hypothetical protein